MSDPSNVKRGLPNWIVNAEAEGFGTDMQGNTINFGAGGTVTPSSTTTFTNKTMDYNSNTFLNFPSGTVTPSSTNTFTNKTMSYDGGGNVFQDIPVPYYYYIYIASGVYKCLNTRTGLVESSSATDASIPINHAVSNAPGNGTVHIETGQYEVGAQINLSGLRVRLEGAGNQSDETNLIKNYSDTVNGFIKIHGDSAFTQVELRNLCLTGDTFGIGVDCFDINQLYDFIDTVQITAFGVGIQFQQCYELNFRGVVVTHNTTYGVHYLTSTAGPSTNQYYYGGIIEDSPVNVQFDDHDVSNNIAIDDATFYSVMLDGQVSGQTRCVYIGIGNTRVKMYGCSFETGSTVTDIIQDQGSANSIVNCRFGNGPTNATILAYHATSNCTGSTFAFNGFDMITNNQTWNIQLDSGANQIKIIGNTKNNHASGCIMSITNNTVNPSGVEIIGNQDIGSSLYQPVLTYFSNQDIAQANGSSLITVNPTSFQLSFNFAHITNGIYDGNGGFAWYDSGSAHQYVIQAASLAASRTINLPALTANDTFVFLAATQTLTNKTLTSPTITNPAINYTATTSIQSNGSNIITVTPASFELAFNFAYLTNAIWDSNGGFAWYDSNNAFQYVVQGGALAASRTVSLPVLTASDTFVFAAFAQTLTNKTLDSTNNFSTNSTGSRTPTLASNLPTAAAATTNATWIQVKVGGTTRFIPAW